MEQKKRDEGETKEEEAIITHAEIAVDYAEEKSGPCWESNPGHLQLCTQSKYRTSRLQGRWKQSAITAGQAASR